MARNKESCNSLTKLISLTQGASEQPEKPHPLIHNVTNYPACKAAIITSRCIHIAVVEAIVTVQLTLHHVGN
jgi:hypothetical protein